MARVYISSTFKDLQREREAVADAIRRRGHFAAGMEVDRATEEPPLEACLEDVRSCQLYIGIFAWRCGFTAPNQARSITELEYEQAGHCDIPRLIFLVHEEADWPPEWTEKDERILALRARLESRHRVRHFTSPETLKIEVLTSLERELKTAPPIDPRLPYLSDRGPQEHQLEETLDLWRSRERSRPLVCVVHGEQIQCLDEFLVRLQSVSLPRMLGPEMRRAALTSYFVKWPLRCASQSQFQQRLVSGLAREVLQQPAAMEEVNRVMARNPGPVLVWTRVLSEECQPIGVLHSFLDVWQRWPDLGPGQQLLVFLVFKYRARAEIGWLRKWFSRRGEDLDELVRTLDFSKLDGIEGVLLSELGSVGQQEVEDWVDQYAAELYRDAYLHKAIRDLFKRWEAETSQRLIPMETLAERLLEMLKTCSA